MSTSRTFRSTQFGAPGVMPQSLGIPPAAFPGRVATNSDLIVAVDRQQTRLAAALNSSDVSMTVVNPEIIGAFNLLSIDDELVKTTGAPTGNVVPISRGFDGTTPAVHLAGAAVSGMVDAWHHNALVAEVEAIEGALGPNLSLLPVSPVVAASQYNFPSQTPGGSLTPGNQVIMLSPVPQGVNGTDANHYLYISGGTGAAEAVLITGGTAVSGAASGTVIVTCANSHSGAWTIQSASGGIYESIVRNPFRSVYMPAGTYRMYATLKLPYTNTLKLYGDGYDATTGAKGTILDFSSLAAGQPAISIIRSGGSSLNTIELRDFGMMGSSLSTGGDGIYLERVIRVVIAGVTVSGFYGDGIHTEDAFEICIEGRTHVANCGKYGVHLRNTVNLVAIRDSYINFNSRLNGYGNIGIIGDSSQPSANTIVLLDNVDVESAGGSPYNGQTMTLAYGLYVTGTSGITVSNCYFEFCVGPNLIFYGQNFGPPFNLVSSLTEFGNWIVGGMIVYSAQVTGVRSWGNTFSGASALRTFQNPDLSTYDIGPDTAWNGSPESTNHPRLLSLAGSTGSGSAALGANCPATTLTAPFTWLRVIGPDGSILRIPAWK